eukprot:scaffold2470_cov158-Amphora_coffeaeformis.AAC.13
MILSPAKSLDLSPYKGSLETTLPECDMVKTLQVAKAMKKHNGLAKLLSASPNIAKIASEYWRNFRQDGHDVEDSKPCVYAFSGAAYQGLQINACSDDTVLYLQNNLRIIDPLYGALRPLDKIQAYRLEMATKGVFPNKDLKLNIFWKESVTASLAKDLKDRPNKIVLNVASDEYSSAVDDSGLPSGTVYVKVVFLDGGRVVSVHAKRARGLMAKFVAEHQCQTLEDVKKFDSEGYSFVESKSDDTCLTFERTKEAAQKRKSSVATLTKTNLLIPSLSTEVNSGKPKEALEASEDNNVEISPVTVAPRRQIPAPCFDGRLTVAADWPRTSRRLAAQSAIFMPLFACVLGQGIGGFCTTEQIEFASQWWTQVFSEWPVWEQKLRATGYVLERLDALTSVPTESSDSPYQRTSTSTLDLLPGSAHFCNGSKNLIGRPSVFMCGVWKEDRVCFHNLGQARTAYAILIVELYAYTPRSGGLNPHQRA